jgi:aldose 1-epimerase
MNNHLLQAGILATFLLSAQFTGAQYAAVKDGDVVRLEDKKTDTVVSIIPSVGAVVFEMKVHGQNVIFFSPASLDAFRQRPSNTGIPFLGPWANRLDEQAFYANGKRFPFNMDLGNVTGAHPIHGFLSYAPREVVMLKADGNSAWLTTRLDVYRNPSWMAQFPFAHTVEVTHRLRNGELEVTTSVENLSSDPMPLSIGFHPYFQLTDSPRDEWTLSVPAHIQYLLSNDKIPTGETRPIQEFFPTPQSVALKDFNLDDVFGDLARDASGQAKMSVAGRKQKIEVVFGPKYTALVLYSPRGSGRGDGPSRSFVCFEPMTGITDAMNLAHKGLYKDLQTIPPRQTWQESFWIRPSGF